MRTLLFLAAFFCYYTAATHSKLLAKTDSSTIHLQSDINSTLKATDQIRESFGKYSIESPELYDGNHQDFEHIQIIEDRKLGSAFVFYIHRDLDGDRDKVWPKGLERQRNEIKGYQSSSPVLKAKLGEVSRYQWNLKIDPSFSLTHNFCHFFQLKPVGTGKESDPVLTLSGSIHRGKPQLEICWWTKGKTERLHIADWNTAKGKWLICECKSHFSPNGTLHFSLRSLDNKINFKHEMDPFNSWRTSYSFVRPKWGIYRSLINRNSIINEEDKVFMDNFFIQKWSDLPGKIKSTNKELPQ